MYVMHTPFPTSPIRGLNTSITCRLIWSLPPWPVCILIDMLVHIVYVFQINLMLFRGAVAAVKQYDKFK